jgi:cell division septum initiation protein DivIVA
MHDTRRWRAAALAAAVGLAGAALAAPAALAQTADATSEATNFSFPFTPGESVVLGAEGRKAMRDLEDRQLRELRVLEDRFASDVRALMAKQHQERLDLRRKFQR